MPRITSVGLDLSEKSLRYAVLRRGGSRDRLLRLGHVEFAFDVRRALMEPGGDDERAALAKAVLESVADTNPDVVRVALHPPHCRSFFSRAGDDSDTLKRARFEAELLGFCVQADESTVSADSAYSDADGDRIHVSVISAEVLDRMGWVVEGLGCEDAQAVSGVRAAAEVFRRMRPGRREGPMIAIGQFEHLTEVSILEAQGWRFAVHHSSTGLEPDVLAAALRAAGESGAPTVTFYGADEGRDRLAVTLGARSTVVDPLQLVEYDPELLHARQASEHFLAALGAALL